MRACPSGMALLASALSELALKTTKNPNKAAQA